MVPTVTLEGIHCPLLLTASDAGAAAAFPLPAIFCGGGKEEEEDGAWKQISEHLSLREFLAMKQGMESVR